MKRVGPSLALQSLRRPRCFSASKNPPTITLGRRSGSLGRRQVECACPSREACPVCLRGRAPLVKKYPGQPYSCNGKQNLTGPFAKVHRHVQSRAARGFWQERE